MIYGLNLRDMSGYSDNIATILARSAAVMPTPKFSPVAGNSFALSGSGGSPATGGLSAAERWIIGKESSGRTTAQNPTSSAFGLGQLLSANRKTYAKQLGIGNPNTTNYNDQLAMMRLYIKQRYGTAENAQKFWQRNGWY